MGASTKTSSQYGALKTIFIFFENYANKRTWKGYKFNVKATKTP
jgi:hypothetical protein